MFVRTLIFLAIAGFLLLKIETCLAFSPCEDDQVTILDRKDFRAEGSDLTVRVVLSPKNGGTSYIGTVFKDKSGSPNAENCQPLTVGRSPTFDYAIATLALLSNPGETFLIVRGRAMLLGDCCRMLSLYLVDWTARELRRLPDDRFLTPELGRLRVAVVHDRLTIYRATRIWDRKSESLWSNHRYTLQKYVYLGGIGEFKVVRRKVTRTKYDMEDDTIDLFAAENFH